MKLSKQFGDPRRKSELLTYHLHTTPFQNPEKRIIVHESAWFPFESDYVAPPFHIVLGPFYGLRPLPKIYRIRIIQLDTFEKHEHSLDDVGCRDYGKRRCTLIRSLGNETKCDILMLLQRWQPVTGAKSCHAQNTVLRKG
jgi:hypothetical protein